MRKFHKYSTSKRSTTITGHGPVGAVIVRINTPQEELYGCARSARAAAVAAKKAR